MEPFISCNEYNLLVCTVCRHAVLVREVKTHLDLHHKQLPPATRQDLVRTTALLSHYPSQDSLKTFRIPTVPVPAIPELAGPYGNGLQCRKCPFIVRTIRGMQKHCAKVHGWVNVRKRGGNVKKKAQQSYDYPWIPNIHCQRFFIRRAACGWFAVIPNHPSYSLSGDDTDGDADDNASTASTSTAHSRTAVPAPHGLDSVLASFRAARDRTATTIVTGNNKAEPNPWLRRTGWATHLAGQDIQFIYRTAALDVNEGWVDDEDGIKRTALQLIYGSIDRLAAAAVDVCSYDDVGIAVLFEIGRKNIDVKPPTPFSAQVEPATLRRYTNTWKRIVGYLFRTMDIDEDERPCYDLLESQQSQLDRMQRTLRRTPNPGSDSERQTVDRTVLDLLVSLLDHPLQGDVYDSVILSALAAMGVREDGGWCQPEDYTGLFSATIKIARMLVVLQSRLEDDESERPGRIFTIVRQKVSRFMTRTHPGNFPTPMDWMFDTRTYGRSIRYKTAAPSCISWDGNTVTYRTVTLSMDKLTEALHQLMLEMDALLDKLLFSSYGVKPPYISLNSLYDDMGNDDVFFWFIKDHRNMLYAEMECWLFRQMVDVPKLRAHFFQEAPHTSPRARTAQLQDYLATVDAFRKLLLIAIHLLAGQPARMTELLSLRYQNTPGGGLRNVFIQNHMVCIVTQYHKGFALSNQTKVIHRYLPQELGELFVRYLLLVLPFAQSLKVYQLNGSCGPGPATISAFLWEDQIVQPPAARACDKDLARLWSSDKMRRTLQSFAVRHLHTPLNISSWRHIAIAIGRRYLRDVFGGDLSVNESYGDSDTEDDGELPDNPLDLQAGHSTYTANAIYAREQRFGSTGLFARQEQFRKASTAWHRYFQFGAADAVRVRKPKVELFDKERHTVRQLRLKQLQSTNLLGTFRQLIGNNTATFRGNQEAALNAVIFGHTPILQVSSTGVGKSMTYLLPAYVVQAGTTVVITPFIALQDDIQERCRTVNIRCEIWAVDEVSDASIVLVTPEAFSSKRFQDYLSRLVGRHQLDRIVLDECHTILDSNAKFRPALREIGHTLTSYRVQLVFLTATLPPQDEPEFWTTLGILRGRAYAVRGCTNRPEIQYTVRTVPRTEDVNQEVMRMVDTCAQHLEQHSSNGLPPRVIIYCQSINHTEELAQLLGCEAYNSTVGTRAERQGIVRRWRAMSGPIVSTSALGVGIDIPDVRMVIHAGQPRSLRDFVQESGRAGRDGNGGVSAVIVPEASVKAPDTQRPGSGKEDIAEYLSERASCRRAVLSRVMDGDMGRFSCENDGSERQCDICTARSPCPSPSLTPYLPLHPGVEPLSTDNQEQGYRTADGPPGSAFDRTAPPSQPATGGVGLSRMVLPPPSSDEEMVDARLSSSGSDITVRHSPFYLTDWIYDKSLTVPCRMMGDLSLTWES